MYDNAISVNTEYQRSQYNTSVNKTRGQSGTSETFRETLERQLETLDKTNPTRTAGQEEQLAALNVCMNWLPKQTQPMKIKTAHSLKPMSAALGYRLAEG